MLTPKSNSKRLSKGERNRLIRRITAEWQEHRTAQLPDEPRLNSAAPEDDSRGAICAQWKRCGRANCRCTQGELHGPYYYRFYRENGRLKKQYLSTKSLSQ